MAHSGRLLAWGMLACAISVSSCRKQVPAVLQSDVIFVNTLGMRFAPVEGTTVLFSVFETRDAEFQAFVKATGLDWIPPDAERGGDYPAANVTWDDAVAFCRWLTEQEQAAQPPAPPENRGKTAAGRPRGAAR